MYPLGMSQVNCFRTHNELTMYPLGILPFTPSGRRSSGLSETPHAPLPLPCRGLPPLLSTFLIAQLLHPTRPVEGEVWEEEEADRPTGGESAATPLHATLGATTARSPLLFRPPSRSHHLPTSRLDPLSSLSPLKQLLRLTTLLSSASLPTLRLDPETMRTSL